jgi:hypothetical protein
MFWLHIYTTLILTNSKEEIRKALFITLIDFTSFEETPEPSKPNSELFLLIRAGRKKHTAKAFKHCVKALYVRVTPNFIQNLFYNFYSIKDQAYLMFWWL